MSTNNALNRPIDLSNGQIYIGSNGTAPVANTITAGDNISIVNGAGDIVINAEIGAQFLRVVNNLSDVANTTDATLNLFTNKIVDGFTSLNAGDFGKVILLKPSPIFVGYDIVLPAAESGVGKYIDIVCQVGPGRTRTVEILTVGSSRISGQPSITVGRGDALRLMSNGGNWFILNQILAENSFLANMTLNQTLPHNTQVVIAFDNIINNVGGGYNATTRTFSPQLPGRYEIYLAATMGNGTVDTAGSIFLIDITKNGSYLSESRTNINQYNNRTSGAVSIVDNQSTTDTYSTAARQVSNQSRAILSSDYQSYFGARRVSLF